MAILVDCLGAEVDARYPGGMLAWGATISAVPLELQRHREAFEQDRTNNAKDLTDPFSVLKENNVKNVYRPVGSLCPVNSINSGLFSLLNVFFAPLVRVLEVHLACVRTVLVWE